MKKILFIFSYLVMITCALLINQACQENYEMVDPPLITGTDDLDEEVIIPKTWNVIMSLQVERGILMAARGTMQ